MDEGGHGLCERIPSGQEYPREDQEGKGKKGKKEGKKNKKKKIRVVIALKPHERQGPHKNKDKPEGTPGERHSEAKGLRQPGPR
jgi:hypothetical protein